MGIEALVMKLTSLQKTYESYLRNLSDKIETIVVLQLTNQEDYKFYKLPDFSQLDLTNREESIDMINSISARLRASCKTETVNNLYLALVGLSNLIEDIQYIENIDIFPLKESISKFKMRG